MSIGFSSLVSGIAGTQAAQTNATDAARGQDNAQQIRARQSADRAADATAKTEEDAQAGERDADGRRPWELRANERALAADSPATESASSPPISRDATGKIGKQLDLSG